MKKVILYSAMASVMAMLGACSSEEGPNPNGSSEENAQQIVLRVASSGDGLQTRAGRDLYSSEAKQEIDNVKVIICNKSNEVVFVKTITNWMGQGDDNKNVSTTYANGREATITLTGEDELNGDFTVYAVGYSNGSAYNDLETVLPADGTKSGEFGPNTILTINNGAVGEEIFAGSIDITAQKGVGFKNHVVLNRQVAGTFGYFTAIPFDATAETLELVACHTCSKLVLGNFDNADFNNAGSNNPHVNYVVNGADPGDTETVIYTIKLRDWFEEGKIKDDNNDGIVDTDNWKNAIPKAKFKTGSVFGGSFIIPFAKVGEKNTFELRLKAGTTVLRKWAVTLPSGDGQRLETGYTLTSWAGNDGFKDSEGTIVDGAKTYNIVRNHLYGIGTRSLDNPTDPDDPEPDDPKDEPENLDKKQELVLRVNHNWEVIHNMGLEEI